MGICAECVEGSIGTVEVGGRVSGRLEEGDCLDADGRLLDVWRLERTDDTRATLLQISLRPIAGRAGGFQPVVRLLDASCRGLSSTCCDATQEAEACIVHRAWGGTNSIVVTSALAGEGGDYELVVEPLDACHECCSSCEVGNVKVGGSVSGRLEDGDCEGAGGRRVDLHRLEVPVGIDASRVRISLRTGSPGFAPRVQALSGQCFTELSSDLCLDGEAGESCLIVEPGFLRHVAVTSVNPGETGRYELSVEPHELCIDCVAGTLSCGERVSGRLAVGDCLDSLGAYQDVWKLEVPSRGHVVIRLRTTELDPRLLLHDAGCEFLEVIGGAPAVLTPVLDPGTYHVVASARSGERGDYEIEVECLDRCGDCLAGELTADGTVTGRLTLDDCAIERDAFLDVWELGLDEARQVTLELISGDFDPVLQIRDDRCLIVDSNDDCVARNSCLTTLLPAGTYFVVATSYEGAETGDYSLSVRTDEAEEVLACRPECLRGELFLGESVNGHLDRPGACTQLDGFEVDTYLLELPEAGTVEIGLVANLELWRAQAGLHLFDEACTPLAVTRDCSVEGDSRPCILEESLEAGRYRVAVSYRDFDASRGIYNLAARFSPQTPASFLRGDCDGDGQVEGLVTDAIFLLRYLFLGEREPPCLAACDADGDGRVVGQVTDAIYLLQFNFLGGLPPVAPFPTCGPAALETDRTLGCDSSCP